MKNIIHNINKVYILLNLLIWIFPNFNSIDVIGSQWFYLSILNFFGLVFCFYNYGDSLLRGIYKNGIVICFSIFCFWGLFSVFYASNSSEVLIESSRLFSILILLINFSHALIFEKNALRLIVQLSIFCLLVEIIAVLVPTYIQQGTFQNLTRVQVFRGIAANINITAFSILFKIPFVIYKLRISKFNSSKIFFSLLIFISLFTISILGTRGAILASFIIIGMSIIFSLFKGKLKQNLINSLSIGLALTFALLLNSKLQDNKNNKVTNRLATITNPANDSSINERLSYYNLSLESIKDGPIIGMGLGNWKIESIPYVLNDKSTYIVPYHSHNDFLQIGAELGLIGLGLYLMIFGLIFYLLYKLFLSNRIDKHFLEALLLFFVCYLVDANLNFPISRVIIQIFFILILSFLITEYFKISETRFKINLRFIFFFFIFLSPIIIYSNFRVFRSFTQQTKLLSDFNKLEFSGDLSEIANYEMNYPNIGVTTIPLKAMVSIYFTVKDPDKALDLALKSIEDNPYLYLGDVIAARVYGSLKDIDNARKYAKNAYENAPTIEFHAATYLPFLRLDKDKDEFQRISGLLKKSNSKYIWDLYFSSLINIKDSLGLEDKELLKVGYDRFPDYQKIKDFYLTKDYSTIELKNANQFAKRGAELFDSKDFLGAAEEYERALKIIPNEKAYVENLAKSYMSIKRFKKAYFYFNKLVTEFKVDSGEPEYYIGAMLYSEGKVNESCIQLLRSIDKNFSNSRSLYNAICLKGN